MSSYTFGSAPPPSAKFSLSEFNGCTVLIAVGGCHPSFTTQYRTAPAIRCAVAVLNGDSAGEEFHDAMIFNTRAVRQLRGIPGQAIIALVNVDKAAQDAVELLETTPEMAAYANEWAEANPGKVEGLIKTAQEAFIAAEQALATAAPQPMQRPSFPAQRAQVAPAPPPPLGGRPPAPPTSAPDDEIPF